jgi:hypothetical protein
LQKKHQIKSKILIVYLKQDGEVRNYVILSDGTRVDIPEPKMFKVNRKKSNDYDRVHDLESQLMNLNEINQGGEKDRYYIEKIERVKSNQICKKVGNRKEKDNSGKTKNNIFIIT